MIPPIPDAWRVLESEREQPYFSRLEAFVEAERAAHKVFPPQDEVFSALQLTPLQSVRVLVLGQDPYHGEGQGHGLAFSVRPGVSKPPSLVNIFRELRNDLGCKVPDNGYLVPWAQQGVLLMNAVLTVRAHEANSHKGKGWEKFTDAAIRAVNDQSEPVVFVLWGGYAGKKEGLIDTSRHIVLKSAHPSPLSANVGFFGSRPFSRINQALQEAGRGAIDWQIPNL